MNKIEELLKLKELLDSGLINESDFNKKKEELLKSDVNNNVIKNTPNENNLDSFNSTNITNNDNRKFIIFGAIIIVILIVSLIFKNNSNSETQKIKNQSNEKITTIKLPPKDESNVNNASNIDTVSNKNDNKINEEHIETDMDRNINSGIKYKESDKNLNLVYKKVMSMLSTDEKKKLVKEQRKWIKKRDSICDIETQDLKSGSMYSAFLNSCLTEKTESRINELNKIISSKQ